MFAKQIPGSTLTCLNLGWKSSPRVVCCSREHGQGCRTFYGPVLSLCMSRVTSRSIPKRKLLKLLDVLIQNSLNKEHSPRKHTAVRRSEASVSLKHRGSIYAPGKARKNKHQSQHRTPCQKTSQMVIKRQNHPEEAIEVAISNWSKSISHSEDGHHFLEYF